MLGLFILLGIALGLIIVILTAMIVWEARRPPRRTAGYAVAKGLPCDPGELGLDFESWELDLGNGVRLPVWEIVDPERAEASSPSASAEASLTAVFIHGWGQSRIDMLARIDPWMTCCRRIVLYDLRGHGEATGSLSPIGQGEDEDLLRLLERLGDDRFVLVGHSMGALIAIRAAARDEAITDRIAGLVAYGVYTDSHWAIRRRLRRIALPGRPLTDLVMLWLRLRGIRRHRLHEDVMRLRCPLLLVHGTEDDIGPPRHAEQLAATASNAMMHLVEGAGHSDAHAVGGAAHDDVVLEFMKKLR